MRRPGTRLGENSAERWRERFCVVCVPTFSVGKRFRKGSAPARRSLFRFVGRGFNRVEKITHAALTNCRDFESVGGLAAARRALRWMLCRGQGADKGARCARSSEFVMLPAARAAGLPGGSQAADRVEGPASGGRYAPASEIFLMSVQRPGTKLGANSAERVRERFRAFCVPTFSVGKRFRDRALSAVRSFVL
jgi:hypothetical protein